MLPACVLRSISDDEEVNDSGGEVQGHMGFAVDHGDTVPVPIAGPRHATAEQQERRPVQTLSSVQFTHGLMSNDM